jgi:hypothetical protein
VEHMNSPPALTPGGFFMPIAVLFSEKGALLSFPTVNPGDGLASFSRLCRMSPLRSGFA